jgi:hypothetical protein
LSYHCNTPVKKYLSDTVAFLSQPPHPATPLQTAPAAPHGVAARFAPPSRGGAVITMHDGLYVWQIRFYLPIYTLIIYIISSLKLFLGNYVHASMVFPLSNDKV